MHFGYWEEKGSHLPKHVKKCFPKKRDKQKGADIEQTNKANIIGDQDASANVKGEVKNEASGGLVTVQLGNTALNLGAIVPIASPVTQANTNAITKNDNDTTTKNDNDVITKNDNDVITKDSFNA